ncbi:hypothetical protein AB1Y20_011475 [Prymnesium parvum]|uniref:Uncharacterized protein n=1 Tax=Prymnesium parvum TaxID=97485 RepID=A0AB34IIR0_PRYPA
MPRLKVREPSQHAERKAVVTPRAEKGPPSSRTRSAPQRAVTPTPQSRRKQRVFLSKDQQALLLVRYLELPKNKKRKAAALDELCKEFDVCKNYPALLLKRLKEEEKLPVRDGVGGAPERITEEQEVLLVNTLETHAFELTYRQLETLTGPGPSRTGAAAAARMALLRSSFSSNCFFAFKASAAA